MNCTHPGCHCRADTSRNDGFCSDHCARAGRAASGGANCGCGHAACR
jgi:hypothetical protein